MSVVRMIEEPDSDELRAFYDLLERAGRDMGVLNVFKVMAHSPELLRSWWQMMTVLLSKLELPPRYRELAILRLFQVKGGAYGFAHHVRIAKLVGVSDGEISEIARYETSDLFDATDKLVLRYTDAVTRMDVDAPAIAAEVKGAIGERQLVELTFCIANWNLMAHLLEPLQIELEEPVKAYLPSNWRHA